MVKKYTFKKIGTDDFSLEFGDKKYEFKITVNLIKEMQNIVKDARIKMLQDLSKQGVSIKDLVIVKKENGKTIYDNSNKEEMEKAFLDAESMSFFDKLCKKYFELELLELIQAIGLNDEETEKFTEELADVFAGKIPC